MLFELFLESKFAEPCITWKFMIIVLKITQTPREYLSLLRIEMFFIVQVCTYKNNAYIKEQ